MTNRWGLILLFLAIHLGLIFYVYPEKLLEVGESGYWAAILPGCLLEFLMLCCYLAGLAAFPGQDLSAVFQWAGKWKARILLFPLLVFFLMSVVLLVRSHAEIITITLLPRTPIWALLLMLAIPLQVSLVGLGSIMRATVTISFLLIPLIALSLLACLQNTDARFLFPLQPNMLSWNYKALLTGLSAHVGFLFVGYAASRWDMSLPQNRRTLYIVLLISVPFYFLAVYVPLLIFGPDAVSRLRFPLIFSIDTVNLEWLFFNRITLFYYAATLTFVLIYSSVLIWMMAKMLTALYVPASNKIVSAAVVSAAYLWGLFIPDWETIERLVWMNTPFRLYTLICIPLLTWVLGRLKRRRSPA